MGKNNGKYILATTTSALEPLFLVAFILCNCKKYCEKSCSCHSNGQNRTDFYGCGKFCQNTDSPLPGIVLDEDLQRVINFVYGYYFWS